MGSIAQKLNIKAQVAIEFLFGMIVMMLMIYGLMMVFRWTGIDLAARTQAHYATMANASLTPKQQLNPYFYNPIPMRAVWDGNPPY